MYLNGTKCMSLALTCFLSLSVMAKNAVPKVGQGVQKPLCFIENNGQIAGYDGAPLQDVQFKMSTPGMNLFVGNGKLHYQFRKLEDGSSMAPKMRTYEMDVTLLGANPAAKVSATEKQAYYENYYTNHTGHNGITAFAYNKITYREVYPGIDWVLYVKGDNVEYDFVVHPGGDASQIKLQYGGATALGINQEGGISAETPMGRIQEKKPYAYENATGKEVAAHFKLDNNIVSFETGKHSGTYTIDPYILWSTYFGGTNEDVATCVKVSGGGNIYVGGRTSSAAIGLGTPPNPYSVTLAGGFDAFVTRYDAAGVRTFTCYIGGAGNDYGTCIAIDAAGTSIYLGGVTASPAGVASGGAYDGTLTGPTDGFIFKLSNTGARQWATYYGGAASVPLGLSGNDEINGIAVDAANNVYITGRTEGSGLANPGTVFKTTIGGSADAFIGKFTAAGALTFSTYYGGTGVDEGFGVSFDGTNNVVITGQTNSVINMHSAGAPDSTLGGANDAFIAKLNNTGTTRIWGSLFGGPGTEQGSEIICNTVTGAVAIIGYTTSTSGIASANAHQTAYGGGAQDAFVAYFASAGTTVTQTWSTYYGGNDLDFGESICFDPARNVVIAGGTYSTNGIASAGSLQPALAGNYDAFVSKFTPLGQRIWGTYYGGALYDYAFGVICDNAGQIIMAGHTTSTAGISTVGAAQTGYAGGTYDAFVTKFRPDTFALITQPFVDTLVCAGGPITIPYTVSFAFQPGNVFTAQLSNAAGSFAAPQFIGSVTATTGGSISGTIPAVAPGTGYRIRIRASNPSYTSPDDFRNIRIVTSIPAITVGANTPVCLGNTLNLTSSASWTVNSYSWSGPSAFASAAANPSIAGVTIGAEGVYTLSAVHNGCPASVVTIAVDVNDGPPAAAPIAVSSGINCVGGTIYLFADTAAGSITGSYSWTGPGGFTSTDQNPVISPISSADAGDYVVVDTLDGCASNPATVPVTVTPTVPVSISIAVSPNDTVCGGTLVSFTAAAVNGGISPSFQWMKGSMPIVGALSNNWSSATLTDGAAISCVMNSNVTCPSPISATSNTINMNVITNELLVTIFAIPGVSVAPGDSITFTSAVYNAGIAPTYQWQLNSNDIPGATSTTYKKYNVTTLDTVTLVVTSTMACVSPSIAKSNALVIHTNTAINGLTSLPDNIALYPNPNPGSFTVKGNLAGTGIEDVSVAVMNPLGQTVYSEVATLHNEQLNASIRVENLPSGIYLLQLSANGMTKTIRFSVQH